MNKIQVSIIIPCFNEGPTFERSGEKIFEELKKLKANWEIIFVEDKSIDYTRDFIEKFVKKFKNTKAIYHKKNQGRGKSVSDGILASRGPICGYLDVDLEVSERYIPLFVEEIEKGYDLVVGKRFYEGGLRSLTRIVVSKVYAYAVRNIVDLPINDTECGYKFFRTQVVRPLLAKIKSKHWFWDTEICAQAHWSHLKISQIPVIFNRRQEKKSTVRLIPDTVDYIKNLYRLRVNSPKLNG